MPVAKKRFFSKNFKQRGDTIVEVLLCIAIAGFVVAGSYSIASNSLQEGISSTERTEANKLAEGQIEALKLREKNSTVTWSNFQNIQPTTSFCLRTDPGALTEFINGNPNNNWLPVVNPGSQLAINGQTNQITPGFYNANWCTFGNKYYISVNDHTNGVRGQAYWVTVRWQPLGGGPISISQLYYRLPPLGP